MSVNIKQNLLEIIKGIQENRIMEVFEKYYHEDVVMYEKRDCTNRVGKDANRISEQVFADNAVIKEAKVLKLLVDQLNSAYQMFMIFDYGVHRVQRTQWAFQTWTIDVSENYFFYKILPNGDFYFNDIFQLNSYICESEFYSNYNFTLLQDRQYTHIIEGIIKNKFVGYPPTEKPHIEIKSFYSPMPIDGVNQFSFNSSSLGNLKSGYGYYKFTNRALFPFTIGLFLGVSRSGSDLFPINLLTLSSDYTTKVPYFERDFWKIDKGLQNTIVIIQNVNMGQLNENKNIIYSYIKETECTSPYPPLCPKSYLPKLIYSKNNLCLNYAIPTDQDSACYPVSLEYCSPKPICTKGYDLFVLPTNHSVCPNYLCEFSSQYTYININKEEINK